MDGHSEYLTTTKRRVEYIEYKPMLSNNQMIWRRHSNQFMQL